MIPLFTSVPGIGPTFHLTILIHRNRRIPLSGSNCHQHTGERRQLCGAKLPFAAVLGTSPKPRR